MVAVEEVDPANAHKYRVIAGEPLGSHSFRATDMVEKPPQGEAPSNLAIVGRYILTPAIFDHLETIPRGAGGEIQLTDAIQELLDGEPVMAYRFEGKRYDCGNKLGYLQATVEFALKHPDLREPFMDYLVTEFGQQARKILSAINR